jgi:hypothetical protein
MTDDLTRPAPDDPEMVDTRRPGGPDADLPDQPDDVGPETDVPTRDETALKEGADAPDAADIEDPERQL